MHKTKTTNSIEDIQAHIEAGFSSLSPSMQKFARFVMDEPSRIALLPIRQASALAGVSTSTAIRFASMLGFKGYQPFRDVYRTGLALTGASRYGAHTSRMVGSGTKGDGTDFWHSTTENLVNHLINTHKTISAAEIKQTANLMLNARRIGIAGSSGMFPAAHYFGYVLNLVRDNVRFLGDRISAFDDGLSSFDEHDVVLIISFDPYAVEAVHIAQYCDKHAVPVIAVTDSSVSPVALSAQHKLIVPTSSTNFYQTLVPTLCVFEAVLSNIVSEIGEDAVRRVNEKFKYKEEIGMYWRQG